MFARKIFDKSRVKTQNCPKKFRNKNKMKLCKYKSDVAFYSLCSDISRGYGEGRYFLDTRIKRMHRPVVTSPTFRLSLNASKINARLFPQTTVKINNDG